MAHKNMNRREFIGKTAFGLCSASLGLPFLGACQTAQKQSYRVISRTLGRTDLRVPIVSFGVMNSDSPGLLKKALDIGIKHFDTAHVYLRGNSEKVIGEVLGETGRREQVYIGTKIRLARDREKNVFLTEDNTPEPGATIENFNNQLETSLERLRTDYIDILYLHSCYSPEMVTFEPMMQALSRAKESGKARFIGITTHKNEGDVIRAAVDTGIYDVIQTAYNYMQEEKEEIKNAIRYAAENGVGIVTMKTFGGNRVQADKSIEVNHEAALKWVLNDENVCTTIPGMTTFAQMDLNFRAMSNLTLTEGERRDLQLTSMLRGTLYCQNCRTCIATCPHQVEIPTLMRAYMYAEGYGNLVHAGITLGELQEQHGIHMCRNCTACTASCRNGIHIEKRLKSLLGSALYRT